MRQDLVAMVQKSNPRRIVLTHIAPGEVDEEATVRVVSEGYKGKVVIGRDLLEVAPDASSAASSAGGSSTRPNPNLIMYVNAAHSAAGGDGKTWATAFATLQEGLEAAQKQGAGEVWVARGTYKPTAGTDRGVSFQLRKGVAAATGFQPLPSWYSTLHDRGAAKAPQPGYPMSHWWPLSANQ